MTTTMTRKHTSVSMIEDLGEHTVAEAVAVAHQLWPASGLGLQPGKAKAALMAADRINAWAKAKDVTRLCDLDGKTCRRMLFDITGATKHTQDDHLDKLHFYRNTVIALRAAVLIAAPVPDRSFHHRPMGDTLAAGMPELEDRTEIKRRPLTDDEILLTRSLVHIDLQENATPKIVNAYLIADAGVQQMPATELTTANLNDRNVPTRITCNKTWVSDHATSKNTRTIKLDNFTTNALARNLTRLTGTVALAYGGASPGTKGAAASLNPVLARYLRRAGITTGEVTALSINLWRPYRALTKKNDIKTARKIHGGRTRNLLASFHAAMDETDLHRGKLHIIDLAEGTRIATVNAADAHDSL